MVNRVAEKQYNDKKNSTESGEKDFQSIDNWIKSQKFKTTGDIKVPERLLDQVIGQDQAVEIVRKAAEQKRHVMLIGDPGTGKSMVARAMTAFLPKEELEDIIAYPNTDDSNTPHIRVVPGGKANEIVKAQRTEAKKRKTPSIAYTYSEPITYYEYMYDTAKLAREVGLKNVLVSNGYINRKPLIRLCKNLDGGNVNLKSFDDRIYRSLNGGKLQPVLNTFKTLHTEGVWFEMTTLVVPTYVDDTEMIKRMCGWILKELGPNYPLHFLRFFPHYKLTRLPATPIGTLEEFRKTALQEGIRYVYLGNVPGHEGTHTYCHNCHKILIERKGYFIPQHNLENGRCKFCGTSIPGRWG